MVFDSTTFFSRPDPFSFGCTELVQKQTIRIHLSLYHTMKSSQQNYENPKQAGSLGWGSTLCESQQTLHPRSATTIAITTELYVA